jgi:hypothetical protein
MKDALRIFEARLRLGEFHCNGLKIDAHSIDGEVHLIWDVPHSMYQYVCVEDTHWSNKSEIPLDPGDCPLCERCLRVALVQIKIICQQYGEPY